MTQVTPEKYGPWALVTGAARGLGYEFARQLAERGFSLILVDKLDDQLAESASALSANDDIDVIYYCVDLAQDHFMGGLLEAIGDRQVGLLINNAGIAKIGEFLPQSIDFLTAQLSVNTRAVLHLTHYFANKMAEQERGGIIIVGSLAAEVASAYNANYCGTKAYDVKFAESLWAELRPRGIDVLGFMPSSTATPGYAAEGSKMTESIMDVESTVSDALRFLGRVPSVVAGKNNRISNFVMTRLLSRMKAIQLVSSHIRKTFLVKGDS